MLIYDYGTDDTLVKDYHSWDNACAYTDKAASYIANQYSSKGEVPEVRVEPEHLVVARNSDEHIPYHSDSIPYMPRRVLWWSPGICR